MYECKLCGKEFDTPSRLGGHASGHKRSGKTYVSRKKKYPNHTCPKCGKIFEKGIQLGGHIRRCTQVFEEMSNHAKRQFLFKECEYKCSQCGENRTRECGGLILEIDHVDGDHTNNSRQNLQVLCPSCHALTPNFRNWGRTSKRKTSKRLRKGNKDFVPRMPQ